MSQNAYSTWRRGRAGEEEEEEDRTEVVVPGRRRRGLQCSRARAVEEEGSRAPWKRKGQRRGAVAGAIRTQREVRRHPRLLFSVWASSGKALHGNAAAE
jgi:hypothetical protein